MKSEHWLALTCPALSCHHCSVTLPTCPRTLRQWAACRDQTLLLSYPERNKSTKQITYWICNKAQAFLPLLEDKKVGESSQNYCQNAWVLQELLETKCITQTYYFMWVYIISIMHLFLTRTSENTKKTWTTWHIVALCFFSASQQLNTNFNFK